MRGFSQCFSEKFLSYFCPSLAPHGKKRELKEARKAALEKQRDDRLNDSNQSAETDLSKDFSRLTERIHRQRNRPNVFYGRKGGQPLSKREQRELMRKEVRGWSPDREAWNSLVQKQKDQSAQKEDSGSKKQKATLQQFHRPLGSQEHRQEEPLRQQRQPPERRQLAQLPPEPQRNQEVSQTSIQQARQQEQKRELRRNPLGENRIVGNQPRANPEEGRQVRVRDLLEEVQTRQERSSEKEVIVSDLDQEEEEEQEEEQQSDQQQSEDSVQHEESAFAGMFEQEQQQPSNTQKQQRLELRPVKQQQTVEREATDLNNCIDEKEDEIVTHSLNDHRIEREAADLRQKVLAKQRELQAERERKERELEQERLELQRQMEEAERERQRVQQQLEQEREQLRLQQEQERQRQLEEFREEQRRLQEERERQEQEEKLRKKKEKEERERLQAEKDERERIQAQKEEQERQEQLELERLRQEQKKLEREKQEQLERERQEKERLARIKLEQQKREQEEREREEAEIKRIKAEQERIRKEQLEKEQKRQEAERAKLEREEAEKKRQKELEVQKLIREQNEQIEREKQMRKLEEERLQREYEEEQARLAQQRAIIEKEQQEEALRKEKQKREIAKRLQEEDERLEREERERKQKERLLEEQLRQKAEAEAEEQDEQNFYSLDKHSNSDGEPVIQESHSYPYAPQTIEHHKQRQFQDIEPISPIVLDNMFALNQDHHGHRDPFISNSQYNDRSNSAERELHLDIERRVGEQRELEVFALQNQQFQDEDSQQQQEEGIQEVDEEESKEAQYVDEEGEEEAEEELQSQEVYDVDEDYEEEEDGEYEDVEEEGEDDHEMDLEYGEDDENDSFVQAQIREYKKSQGISTSRRTKTNSAKRADMKKQEPEYFPYSNRGKLTVTQKTQPNNASSGLGFFSDSQSQEDDDDQYEEEEVVVQEKMEAEEEEAEVRSVENKYLRVPNRGRSQDRYSASKNSHLGFVDDEESQMEGNNLEDCDSRSLMSEEKNQSSVKMAEVKEESMEQEPESSDQKMSQEQQSEAQNEEQEEEQEEKMQEEEEEERKPSVSRSQLGFIDDSQSFEEEQQADQIMQSARKEVEAEEEEEEEEGGESEASQFDQDEDNTQGRPSQQQPIWRTEKMVADIKRGGQQRNLHISEKLRLAREHKDRSKKAGTVSAAKRATMTPKKLVDTPYYQQKKALERIREQQQEEEEEKEEESEESEAVAQGNNPFGFIQEETQGNQGKQEKTSSKKSTPMQPQQTSEAKEDEQTVFISLKHSPSSHMAQSEMIKRIKHTLNRETILVKNDMAKKLMLQFQQKGSVSLTNQEFKEHFQLIRAFGLKEKQRFFVISEKQMMDRVETLEGFNSQSAILIPHLKKEDSPRDKKRLGFVDGLQTQNSIEDVDALYLLTERQMQEIIFLKTAENSDSQKQTRPESLTQFYKKALELQKKLFKVEKDKKVERKRAWILTKQIEPKLVMSLFVRSKVTKLKYTQARDKLFQVAQQGELEALKAGGERYWNAFLAMELVQGALVEPSSD